MRRSRWFIAAALLLAAAAVLLVRGGRASGSRRAPPEPARANEEEVARMQRRATLLLPRAAGAPATPTAPPAEPRRRDPFLVALPVKPDAPVVVFEANALRHSRLGQLLLACIQAREPGKLDRMEQEVGIDPLRDVDRVAFLGDAMVVSGFFQRLRWRDVDGLAEQYGQAGKIYRQRGKALGAWGDSLVLIADRPEDVRQAIDQLEGRSPVPESGIPEEMTYGEIYGALPVALVRQVLGAGDMSDRLAAAGRIELNVNAMQDVAATVRIRGQSVAGLADLASSIEASLTQARGQAQQATDLRLTELLESARVKAGEEGLSLQLSVPADRLDAWFQGCERWGPPPAQ